MFGKTAPALLRAFLWLALAAPAWAEDAQFDIVCPYDTEAFVAQEGEATFAWVRIQAGARPVRGRLEFRPDSESRWSESSTAHSRLAVEVPARSTQMLPWLMPEWLTGWNGSLELLWRDREGAVAWGPRSVRVAVSRVRQDQQVLAIAPPHVSALPVMPQPYTVHRLKEDRLFPSDERGLGWLKAIVILNQDLESWQPAQKSALDRWVRRGGLLIIAADAPSRLASDWGRLPLPARAGAATRYRLAADPWRAGASDDAARSVAGFELALVEGARFCPLFTGAPARSLAVNAAGEGAVVVSAFPWDRADLASVVTETLTALVKQQEMTPALTMFSTDLGERLVKANNALDGALTVEDLYFLLGLIALYLVLAGPANFLALSLLKRKEWSMITTPVLVLAFVAAFASVGMLMKGTQTRVNSFSVGWTESGSPDAVTYSLATVFSPRHRRLELSAADDATQLSDPGAAIRRILGDRWWHQKEALNQMTLSERAGRLSVSDWSVLPWSSSSIASSRLARLGVVTVSGAMDGRHGQGDIENATVLDFQGGVLLSPWGQFRLPAAPRSSRTPFSLSEAARVTRADDVVFNALISPARRDLMEQILGAERFRRYGGEDWGWDERGIAAMTRPPLGHEPIGAVPVVALLFARTDGSGLDWGDEKPSGEHAFVLLVRAALKGTLTLRDRPLRLSLRADPSVVIELSDDFGQRRLRWQQDEELFTISAGQTLTAIFDLSAVSDGELAEAHATLAWQRGQHTWWNQPDVPVLQEVAFSIDDGTALAQPDDAWSDIPPGKLPKLLSAGKRLILKGVALAEGSFTDLELTLTIPKPSAREGAGAGD